MKSRSTVDYKKCVPKFQILNYKVPDFVSVSVNKYKFLWTRHQRLGPESGGKYNWESLSNYWERHSTTPEVSYQPPRVNS